MSAPDPLDDARTAARLLAIDPTLGGMVLRGGGEIRDRIVAAIDRPVRRLPVHVDDERLLGGLDLAATLASGAPVTARGLLAESDGGVLLVPMAERMAEATAGRIAAAVDQGAAFVLVLLDEGIEDERPPDLLMERVAFHLDLAAVSRAMFRSEPASLAKSRTMDVAPEILTALSATAAALGIRSARADVFALRAARAAARLAGRNAVAAEDAELAVRLVLAPRATQVPAMAEPDVDASAPSEGEGAERNLDSGPIEDRLIAAAAAAVPRDLLDRIAEGRKRGTVRSHGAGERRSGLRGRSLDARAGKPGGGKRLSLIDTLRAAAPWQRVRGRVDRVLVRRDDLRVRRFEARAQALTIFAVDASGSSALARLAEAKGAVELLLAEAYVKRAEVALVAFRGTGAEVLLPPTRSLTRARRSLAELPGGGGTPLAAGLRAAYEMALAGRAKGRTPFLVVLTDGRANIAADGSAGRARADADAEVEAKAIALAGIRSAFVDISPRSRPESVALAAAMGARYLPLPHADAAAMHAAVRAARPE